MQGTPKDHSSKQEYSSSSDSIDLTVYEKICEKKFEEGHKDRVEIKKELSDIKKRVFNGFSLRITHLRELVKTYLKSNDKEHKDFSKRIDKLQAFLLWLLVVGILGVFSVIVDIIIRLLPK